MNICGAARRAFMEGVYEGFRECFYTNKIFSRYYVPEGPQRALGFRVYGREFGLTPTGIKVGLLYPVGIQGAFLVGRVALRRFNG